MDFYECYETKVRTPNDGKKTETQPEEELFNIPEDEQPTGTSPYIDMDILAQKIAALLKEGN